jgi:2TM domain
MSTPLTPDEIDKLARRRAGAKLGWFIHLAVYLVVNTGLLLGSNLMFGHGRYSLGPLLGWGIGLVFHGISVFLLGKGSNLRENMVARERERIERQQRGP